MPRPHPPEFRQRAVELARLGDKWRRSRRTSGSVTAACATGWPKPTSREGRREGLSSREREELVELRREARTLKLENELLKRAEAYFARENVLPKRRTPSSPGSAPTCPSLRAARYDLNLWIGHLFEGAAYLPR
jgi:transposase